MAVLAVAAAGSVIGSAIGGSALFLGMTGASWGWMIGSIVGQHLFGSKHNQQGPRLTEYKITSSVYGEMLPILLGAHRAAGKLIWAGDVYETENKSGSGKRGYITEYRYKQSIRVDFCAGPIQAFRRVWMDSKLVFSAEHSDIVEALQVGAFLEIAKFHYGTEDEDPDPVMEKEGYAQTPAYKESAGIVFDRLDLTQWGNRIPAIHAEVVEFGVFSVPHKISDVGFNMTNGAFRSSSEKVSGGETTVDSSEQPTPKIVTTDWIEAFTNKPLNTYPLWSAKDFHMLSGQVYRQRTANVNAVQFFRADGSHASLNDRFPDLAAAQPYTVVCINDYRLGYQVFIGHDSEDGNAYKIMPTWMAIPEGAVNIPPVTFCFEHTGPYIPTDMIFAGRSTEGLDAGVGGKVSNMYFYAGRTISNTGDPYFCMSIAGSQETDIGHLLYEIGFFPDVGYTPVTSRWPLYPSVTVNLKTVISGLTDGGGGACWIGQDEVTEIVYVYWSSLSPPHLFGFNPMTLELVRTYSLDDLALSGKEHSFAVWNERLLMMTHWDTAGYVYDYGQYILSPSGTMTLEGEALAVAHPYQEAPWHVPLENGVFVTQWHEWTMSPRLAKTGRTLDEVITILCDPVIPEERLNLAAVSDINVPGYLLESQTTRRNAIEPLLVAYGVDLFESDGKLKATQRGGEPVTTVYYKHLGAAVGGDSADRPPEEKTRERTVVLPQRVDVSLFDVARSYQQTNQVAQRGQVLTEQTLSIKLPIADTSGLASRAAWRLLTEAWATRTSREWSTGLQYEALEPSDVIWAERADGTAVRERIISKTERDGVLHFKSVVEDGGVYTQASEGIEGPVDTELVRPPPETDGYVFEVPALSELDVSSITVYAVAAVFPDDITSWPGASIVRSDLNDSTFQTIDTITTTTQLGELSSPLRAWSVSTEGPYDVKSTFTASVVGGVPEEYTEAEQLTGEGLAYVGGELIRYRDCTSLGDSLYEFGGIQRGVLGTDYAAREHGVGSPLILLPPSVVESFKANTLDVGSRNNYRIATIGQNPLYVPPQVLTLAGRTLKPLAPVHLRMYRQANGDRIIAWTRRNRAFQDQWLLGVDVPNSESSLTFTLEICDASNSQVKRTVTVTGYEYYTYTKAQWKADFNNQSPSTWLIRVAQVSGMIGNGDYAEAYITDTTLAFAPRLLYFDGPANGTFIKDTYNTVWNAGPCYYSTSVSKFGGSSIYSPGVSSNYIKAPTGSYPDLNFGEEPFTIDGWFYCTTVSGSRRLMNHGNNGSNTVSALAWNTSVYNGAIYGNVAVGSSWYGSGGGSVSTNTWYHFCMTRTTGDQLLLFLSGSQVGTPVDLTGKSVNSGSDAPYFAGHTGAEYFQGYYDMWRVWKGTCVWNSNFTPPTSAY